MKSHCAIALLLCTLQLTALHARVLTQGMCLSAPPSAPLGCQQGRRGLAAMCSYCLTLCLTSLVALPQAVMFHCFTLVDKCWQAQPLQLPHLQQAPLLLLQPPLPLKVRLRWIHSCCITPCRVAKFIATTCRLSKCITPVPGTAVSAADLLIASQTEVVFGMSLSRL